MAVAEERTYKSREVAELTGISYRRLMQLVEEGVFSPQRDPQARMGNPQHPAYVWTERDLEKARAVLLLRRPYRKRVGTQRTRSRPMTLERAVEVLNREEHRNWSPWTVQPAVPGCTPVFVICDGDREDALYEFEAIAIAEKYERDSRK